MAGLSLIRKWVTKQLTKPNAEGIMKIPDKGNIDFGEMLVKEKLFTSGIDEKLIQSEKQLERTLDSIEAQRKQTLKRDYDEHVGTTRTGGKNYLYTRKEKPKKSGEVIKVDFDKGRWNKAGGGSAKESWTDKLVRWGGGPSVLAGELGLEGINQIYQLLNMPGLYNQGGRAGLSYLLAEDTNERIPYVFGGRTIGVLKNLLTKFKKSSGIPRGEKTLKPDKFAKNLMSEEDKLKLLQFETQYANSILEHLKADRQLFKQLQVNKEMKDEGLDFLMKNFVETQAPHMKNYKNLADIDQAILELETLVKNKTLKEGRQLNAEGGRISFSSGGVGKPPVTFYFDMQGGAGKEQKNFLGIEGLTQKGYDYGGTLAADTTFPLFGGELSVGGELGFGRDKSNVDYKGQPIDWLSNVGETKLGDNWNVGMKWRKKFAGGSLVKGANWLIKSLRGTREQLKTMNMSPGQLKYYLDQIDDQIKHLEAGGPIPEEVIQTIRKDPKFKSVWQNQKSADPDLREIEEVLLEYGQKHAEGGRIGYAGGGMGRRTFLKIMAALGLTGAAAKSGLSGLFKSGKPIAKELTQVPIKNIDGMPAWFKPLVNKIIKEGEEAKVTEYDRLVTHTTKLPDSKTPISVSQDLNNGDVWVDIGEQTKHGWADGRYGQPVRLEYKASEEIPLHSPEGSYSKVKHGDKTHIKTKEEFNVEEAEFTGGHPENVKFEESTISKFGEHESNFDEIEAFATGKTKKGARNVSESFDKMNEDIADHFSNYPTPDDFASGGLAKMLGE